MKNTALVVVLSVLVVILSAMCLLFFVGSTVSGSINPLSAQIGEMKAVQKDIQSKLGKRDDSELLSELKHLNQRLTAIETKINSAGNGNGNGQQRPQRPPEDVNKVYTLDIGDSPVLGNKNAPVTLTAFFDLQCPFCNRFYPAARDAVKASGNKLKLVVKNYPLSFHPNALPAAKLALAAKEQGKYFEMLDLIMQNGGAVTNDKINEYAQKVGLNYKKLMNDYKNKDAEYQKKIDADKALAEKSAFNGTPTFYLNGKKTSARDVDAYKAEVDKILKKK